MDETSFRIRILGGERVIMLKAAKELYTLSPKNYTSITILKAVSIVGKVIPPILIILGKIHTDSWYHSNLKGIKVGLLSNSRFLNS